MDNLALDYNSLETYIQEELIAAFYARRFRKLDAVRLDILLRNKNPYLYRAKNLQSGQDFVKQILDAALSSSEETQFGDLLEQLSIRICHEVYGGWKSAIPGIDLELDLDGIRHIVTIKSGPCWGNSDQIRKMRENFISAKRTLRTSGGPRDAVAVNGCCYGKDENWDKGDYFKLCGQRFWQFISGDWNLYLRLIRPLGNQAQEQDDAFQALYEQRLYEMTDAFLRIGCSNGWVDWEALVEYNSGAKTL